MGNDAQTSMMQFFFKTPSRERIKTRGRIKTGCDFRLHPVFCYRFSNSVGGIKNPLRRHRHHDHRDLRVLPHRRDLRVHPHRRDLRGHRDLRAIAQHRTLRL